MTPAEIPFSTQLLMVQQPCPPFQMDDGDGSTFSWAPRGGPSDRPPNHQAACPAPPKLSCSFRFEGGMLPHGQRRNSPVGFCTWKRGLHHLALRSSDQNVFGRPRGKVVFWTTASIIPSQHEEWSQIVGVLDGKPAIINIRITVMPTTA